MFFLSTLISWNSLIKRYCSSSVAWFPEIQFTHKGKIDTSLVLFGFPSHLGHQRAQSKFPEPYSRFPSAACYMYAQVLICYTHVQVLICYVCVQVLMSCLLYVYAGSHLLHVCAGSHL